MRKPAVRKIPEALNKAWEQNPAVVEEAMREFLEGADPNLARARARALLAGLSKSDLWWLEQFARGEVVPPRDAAQDAPADALSGGSPADAATHPRGDQARQAMARDELDRRLVVGDLDGAAKAARVVKDLHGLPRSESDRDELDLTRLTDRELSCLEYLCELARGNRPKPGSDGEHWAGVIG